MDNLVSKICSDFRGFSSIEVSVLNAAGEQVEIFNGLPALLPIKLFNAVLTASSTFYVMSIIGFRDTYAPENIVRSEFCWLTDPIPPVAESRTPYSLTLKWEPVSFCGIEGDLFFDSITYVLEAAEGYEFQSGMVKNFVPDIAEFDYKLICRGNMLLQAEIVDLKPSTWYHFRIGIEYMGKRIYSESRPIPTSKDVPTPPGKVKISSLESKHNDTQMRICWAQSKCNGSPVEKYQVQVLERHSGVAKSMNLCATSHGQSESKQKTLSSKWRNVYCNLPSETSIAKPDDTVLDMKVRVRAKNSVGWSNFSEPLLINYRSHPTLFPNQQNDTNVKELNSSSRPSSPGNNAGDNKDDVFYLYENALMKSLGKSSTAFRSTSPSLDAVTNQNNSSSEENEIESKIIEDELERYKL